MKRRRTPHNYVFQVNTYNNFLRLLAVIFLASFGTVEIFDLLRFKVPVGIKTTKIRHWCLACSCGATTSCPTSCACIIFWLYCKPTPSTMTGKSQCFVFFQIACEYSRFSLLLAAMGVSPATKIP